MIGIIHNVEVAKNNWTSEKDAEIKLFFKEQLKEFNEKMSSLSTKKTHSSGGKIRSISFDDIKYENSELDKFISDNDWIIIENTIWWEIETFYNFHANVAIAVYKVKGILKDIDPALELAQLGGDTLSTISESFDGNPYASTIVKGFSLVGTLLGFLRQTESEFTYSKDFIFTIFGEIIKVYKTRNIKKIQKVLEIAKESLNKVEYKWNNWMSLNFAKRKVENSLDCINTYVKLAEQQSADENRIYEWESSWY
ncbi:hypothetical protein FCM49_00560 [Mycoplasma bovis]|uniref:hypothetical protein n=1 Tax=Mycoplasmopsis bovis TaxID=28903 RepID=UPI001BDED657|nr:hypothetical protein [Mycoplasmopsis bovis]MBT1345076.1 hypothetical protein [Mycoplasmopsis bovis]MBT1369722.1 hypothetical protein [Mycoplasmopsis bovis]MBT1371053.1 hypothetical protein [Mycoplasmopsis bovis]MBT1376294.1 hypothetical protein [Mycoplasmopsis bovis]MBT1381967.1 hypothetical protein [Mycoplasmopsis bovis]